MGVGFGARAGSAAQRTRPAPVAVRAEVLHALHLLVGALVPCRPRARVLVPLELLLGADVAHRVQEPVAGHGAAGYRPHRHAAADPVPGTGTMDPVSDPRATGPFTALPPQV